MITKKSEHDPGKEWINYYKTNSGKYIGNPVNFPGIIATASSLAELQKKIKAMIQMFINLTFDRMAQEEPFELHETTKENFLKK